MGIVDRADRRLLRGVSARTLALLLGEPEPLRPAPAMPAAPTITVTALSSATRNQLSRASGLNGTVPGAPSFRGRGRRPT